MTTNDPIAPPTTLDALVDATSLRAALEPLWQLSRCPLRVLRADASTFVALEDRFGPAAICQYVDAFEMSRMPCEELVTSLKAPRVDALAAVPDEPVTFRCFTGAEYRASELVLDGRTLGRVVFGPFRPDTEHAADPFFAALDARIDGAFADREFARMPSLSAAQADSVVRGARATILALAGRGRDLSLLRALHDATQHGPDAELVRKNDELERANAHLRELDRVKGNFLATISHELKTPLTSILGYAEMLSENIGGVLADEQRGFVTVISDRARQLLGMITSIIELARMDHGQLRAAQASVSMAGLAREVADTFVPAARKKHIRLETQLDESAMPARGDAGYLRQVLHNLVDNALKFTPEHGSVRIAVRPTTAALAEGTDDDGVGLAVLARPRPCVEVRVSDSGVGIPRAERARVFDAFYQVDTGVTRQFGGAGLGLAIVRRIVDGIGGHVRVEDNDDGVGVAMVVVLPAATS
ncbi:MAG: HAMP domain-containing histidine kinase [Myxococcales bacterium]|nr:HAMP domain-containing histidine kinase [Myxococcales bacterium]